MKQVLKGVAAAFIVGVPLGLYLSLWLHATPWFAVLAVGALGLAIILVVGTRTDESDAAADAAWREAAADLPPVSDRRSLESSQRQMPGPEAARPGSAVKAAKPAAKPTAKPAAKPAGRSSTGGSSSS